ncbi:MAG: glycosyltransferase family 1 protein [Chitinophagaceae bacterium]
MRIGIDVQRIFRPKKHGMEVVALELVRQLQQLDKKNEYVLFAKDDTDRQCITETANFKVQTLPSYTYADWEQFKLPAAVKKQKLDFLHCTSNTAPIAPGVPLLLTLHDIIFLEKVEFKGTAYQNFGNLYRRFVVPRVVKKSKLILTVSHFERNNILQQLHLPEEKVEVVYNAVNPRFNIQAGPAELQEFRKQLNLPEKFILFIGNAAPRKNTQNVIRAFAEYSLSGKDTLPMALLGYDKLLVEKALTELGHPGLIGRFIFPGYLPAAQLPLIYNTATLFLYPSLREGFGLPILEAMGCGAPVITSSTSSMPEVADDAAMLVDPFQYKQIAEGIATMLGNQQLLADYRAKGLERVKLFTWEAAAKQLLSVYDRML